MPRPWYNVIGNLIITFQVHAVGMYGPTGAGVAEHLDFDAYMQVGKTRERLPRSAMDRVDIITGKSDHASLDS
jgi:5-aminolevulinate synthase